MRNTADSVAIAVFLFLLGMEAGFMVTAAIFLP